MYVSNNDTNQALATYQRGVKEQNCIYNRLHAFFGQIHYSKFSNCKEMTVGYLANHKEYDFFCREFGIVEVLREDAPLSLPVSASRQIPIVSTVDRPSNPLCTSIPLYF